MNAVMGVEQATADKVGMRVRWFRRYLDMTTTEFAKAIGVQQSQLAHWETGRARLSIQGSLKIYDKFEVGPDFFFLERTTALPQSVFKAWSSRDSDSTESS